MVEYLAIDGAPPGSLHFRCDRLRATLSATSCAGMWREANHLGHENRHTCKRCPIGAEHAGEALASMSELRGTLTCARCHRQALRLIHGHVCVSCMNREYELLKGRNAKGTIPVKLKVLEARRIWFMAGTTLTSLGLPRTVDASELLVAALRDSKERVRFSFRPYEPRLVQGRLF